MVDRSRFMRTWRAALAFAALHAGPASAFGLMDAYQAALQNDPTYRAAQYENESGQLARQLGHSTLLPNVSLQVSASKNHAERTTATPFGPVTTDPSYISRLQLLSVRQPLYNPEGYARNAQGKAQASYSEAKLAGSRQDLLLRVTEAYLNVLLVEDFVALAAAKRDTLLEQSRANARMFAVGEGTRTDMLETQARLDLAEAELIEANDSLATMRRTLASIVGKEPGRLDRLHRLAGDFRITATDQRSFEEWRAAALEHNAEIAAQRHAVEVAAQEIRKARSGHLPRLDAVASYSKGKSETVNTYDQEANVRSIGFQLNIPIYSGGHVSATAGQAVASHHRTKAELDAAVARTMVELEKNYRATQSSVARNDALAKAVDSARLLVTATQQSVKGGVRVNLDVLNAKQQLFSAQRDLAQARYTYLLSTLRLRAFAGVLSVDDLAVVAGHFSSAH